MIFLKMATPTKNPRDRTVKSPQNLGKLKLGNDFSIIFLGLLPLKPHLPGGGKPGQAPGCGHGQGTVKSWADSKKVKDLNQNQGLVNVPFWGYWTSPYSSHYRPYT